jgi:hypothetical protein
MKIKCPLVAVASADFGTEVNLGPRGHGHRRALGLNVSSMSFKGFMVKAFSAISWRNPWQIRHSIGDQLLAHFFHRRPLEFVRHVTAVSGRQTHARAAAELKGALRRDVDEEKSAVNRRGPLAGVWPALIVRIDGAHRVQGITWGKRQRAVRRYAGTQGTCVPCVPAYCVPRA